MRLRFFKHVAIPQTKQQWERIAEGIYEKVAEALDYWCWEISGDPVEECYSAHASQDLFELAEEFAGWSRFDITDEDLELLREMPDDIYEKYNQKLREAIESVIERLSELSG